MPTAPAASPLFSGGGFFQAAHLKVTSVPGKAGLLLRGKVAQSLMAEAHPFENPDLDVTEAFYRSVDLCLVEFAEQLFFRRPVFRNGTTYPGDIHVVLEMNVLIGDVVAPKSAP